MATWPANSRKRSGHSARKRGWFIEKVGYFWISKKKLIYIIDYINEYYQLTESKHYAYRPCFVYRICATL